MDRKLPIYEARVKGTDNTGIFAMSFVEVPAVEVNFVALAKQYPVRLKLDKQKQILTGPVLIPGQIIYRRNTELGEHYITFTADEIEKIALKMMRTGAALSTTTHQHEKPLRGNYMAEQWIIKDPKNDKAVALGFKDLPAGTLMASYKVEDRAYWANEVLSGKVKGFSLEGLFNFNKIHMKKETKPAAKAAAKPKAKISAFLSSVLALLEGDSEAAAEAVAAEAGKDETDSGTPYLIFELAEGGEVWVDEDGFATLDGEQMPAGEHALADGNFLVIDDAGMLVVTEPEANGAEPAAAPAAMAKQVAEAKERGKQLLAKMAGVKAKDPRDARIAALKKQLAELENEPSTPPAKPTVEGAAGSGKKPEEMTHTEKMAAVIRSRQERAKGK